MKCSWWNTELCECCNLWVIRKGFFFVVVVKCYYCWEILKIFIWLLFFFFLPHSLVVFLFICRSCKMEWKRLGYFKTQILILGFTTILWCECFPEPVEIVVLPQTRRLKDIMESSEAVTSWRPNVLLSLGLNEHVCSLLVAERKRCVRQIRGERLLRKSFTLASGSPSFRYVPISLPVSPFGKLLLLHLFILFFHVTVFLKTTF